MSLIKELWLAIILAIALAFGASLIVNTISSKNYLEKQLQMKNIRVHAHARIVYVQIQCVQDKVRLTIKDNGVGFDLPPQPFVILLRIDA